ncbi:MAG: hypothetical protein IID39_07335 [Planctomycetes bacterium]|nr:hypothetical protein [Planctomycetota bacterium]
MYDFDALGVVGVKRKQGFIAVVFEALFDQIGEGGPCHEDIARIAETDIGFVGGNRLADLNRERLSVAILELDIELRRFEAGVSRCDRLGIILGVLDLILKPLESIGDAVGLVLGYRGVDRLDDVSFVGVYRGTQVPAGRKSLTLRLSFRDPARTLQHDEVDPQVAVVVAALESSFDAKLRA